MTLGTDTFGAPVDTTMFTVESLSTLMPLSGSWSQILPFGWFSHSLGVTVPSLRSLLVSSPLAVCSLSPTRFGTATWLLLALLPSKIHLPIRTAPIRTSTAATTSRIVDVLDFFWRRRSMRSS